MESSSTPEIGEWRPSEEALGLSHRRKMEILFAVLLGLFLSALDQTIVGTALPTIVSDLRGSNELYTWVITIYLLTATITGVFYGKLSDLYGRRPMLLIGVFLFLLGSALSGLSWSMESLVLFRGIQGLGAGALFPISLAIIGDLFSPAERGRYQGLFGAVFGISAIIGPLLGGWMTDTVGWHWIFYVNLPIGAVAMYIIYRYLPSMRRTGAARDLDYLGAVVFTVAISFLLVGLTNKQSADWTAFEVGGYILISLVVGAVFLAIESRARQPIVPLGLFSDRSYSVSIAASFLAAIGFFGAVVFLPRWFQFVKEVSPTESGLQILALLAGVILSSVGSGILISRTGRYRTIILASLAVMSIGLFLMTGLRATTELPVLWIWMFVTGLGIGPTLSAFTIVVQSSVPGDRLGVATSNLTFFRQVGGSVGLALVGTVFGQAFAENLVPSLVEQGIPARFAEPLAAAAAAPGGGGELTQVGGGLRETLAVALPGPAQPFIDQIVAGVYDAFSLAVAATFWLGLAAGLVALAVSFLLPELPLRGMAPMARRPVASEAEAPAIVAASAAHWEDPAATLSTDGDQAPGEAASPRSP
jgi:EmrB/QacA subfamily drug resistance transporter